MDAGIATSLAQKKAYDQPFQWGKSGPDPVPVLRAMPINPPSNAPKTPTPIPRLARDFNLCERAKRIAV